MELSIQLTADPFFEGAGRAALIGAIGGGYSQWNRNHYTRHSKWFDSGSR